MDFMRSMGKTQNMPVIHLREGLTCQETDENLKRVWVCFMGEPILKCH